jgi:hopanoid biosynthesis associated protein HpnK
MAATNAFQGDPFLTQRSVVFNADDFGHTRSINQAVQLAHGAGLLKSASLMASGAAFDEAVSIAQGLEDFEVGVHLCATQTRSCLREEHIPGLLAADGSFRFGLAELGCRLLLTPSLADQIVLEWRAQIERILAAGLRPDHLNSHQHVHMHPVLFGRALDLAAEHGIPLVRMPHTNFRLNAGIDGGRLASKFLKACVFNALRGACLLVHEPSRPGVYAADHTYGLLQIGRTDASYLVKLLPQLPEGVSEIYIHPGLRPEACSPHIRRDIELAALMSPEVAATVEEQKLTVTTFRRWVESIAPEPEPEQVAESFSCRG